MEPIVIQNDIIKNNEDGYINDQIKDAYINFIHEFNNGINENLDYKFNIKYAGQKEKSYINEISVKLLDDKITDRQTYNDILYKATHTPYSVNIIVPTDYAYYELGKYDNKDERRIAVPDIKFKSSTSESSTGGSDNFLYILIIIGLIIIVIIISVILIIFGFGYVIFIVYIIGLLFVLIRRRFKYNDVTWKDSINYSLFSWSYFYYMNKYK